MKFFETLKSLSLSRQLMLAGAVVGVMMAMSFLVRGAMKEPMALLYSGLEAVHAGEIVEELEQRGITYDIRGEAIFIPQSDRDSVRLALAKEGLPQQSIQGYELLDEVNGFSVTSEMYNATYWRAKEGELTRTILAIPGVKSARVHIGASLRSGFARTQPANTASVTLSTAHRISASQAEAIQYLVALAVSGLNPDEVVVIDPRDGILAGPGRNQEQAPGVVADTQANLLELKIQNLIDARVGQGNVRVSVTMDISRESQHISEVTFDPQSRFIRNRTTSDNSESNQGGSPALTVASNLPQAVSQGGGSSGTMKNSTESVAYEVNEVRTETQKHPGEIERISIAVLLNEQALGIDPAAENAVSMAEQIITDFEQLIQSAAGLDLERGDVLTVELMPFHELPVEDMIAAPGLMAQLLERYLWSGLSALLLGLVVIILGVGVIRPLLVRKPDAAADAMSEPGLSASGSGMETADPFEFLKNYTQERQDETAALLQDWLSEDQKAAVNE